jgi:hypothetical protein
MIRQTHTVVELEISAKAYDEIARKLRTTECFHCFGSDGSIDMTGIAIIKPAASRKEIAANIDVLNRCRKRLTAEKVFNWAKSHGLGQLATDARDKMRSLTQGKLT